MARLTSYDPSINQAIGDVTITEPEQVQAVVISAKVAQKNWAILSLLERKKIVIKAYQHLQPIQEQLATLISKEMGKDLDELPMKWGERSRMPLIL